jgi:hypothetical protein
VDNNLVLRPYQEDMRAFVWARPRAALWADMGLGKTPVALTCMVDSLYDRVDVSRWLVVGPKLVVADAWPRQLRRWSCFRGLRWRLLGAEDFGMKVARADNGRAAGLTFGGRAEKRAAKLGFLAGREPVTLVSWDWLPWLVKACGVNWPWDGLVLDEAIFAQSSTSDRHKAVYHVVHRLKAVTRVLELTGAPNPNGYQMLHGQMRLLDGGEALGDTLTDFRRQWMVPDKLDRRSGQVWSWRLGPGCRAEIDRRLQGLAVSLRSDDYLSLPPLVLNPIWIELPMRARRTYDDMERDLVARVDDVDVLAASQGVLVSKLLQIAGGVMYSNAGVPLELHTAKLDRLAELLEAEPGPVLLAYPFRPDWDRIKRRFPAARHVREVGALDAFRQGRCKLLCMHPASGGHGLDGLQEVSSCAVWYGATYNADHWLQFNARLRRDGQRGDRVVVHQLLAADTIEEYVAGTVLSEKLSEHEHLLRALMMRRTMRASSGGRYGST